MAGRKANVFDPNCPSRVVLDRIADKWTGLVVLGLSDGTLRFGELRERVGGVTPKVLTETLRALERDGLVTRKVYAEIPPRVEYALTASGRSLHEPLTAIQTWAERHVGGILAARARSDARAHAAPTSSRSH